MSRLKTLKHIVDLIGPGAIVLDLANGWPGIVTIQTASGEWRVAMHVAEFSERSYRGRDNVERRMQTQIGTDPL